MEIEQPSVARFMAGPVEEVGFYDLTDRLHSEGIYNQLNEPSFAPWSSRGRIFGLPHDVHPVLLCYRADLVEAAGIDVSTIKTWDDFEKAMKPLVRDLNGDGDPDRYALALWFTSVPDIETLLLQAGGGTFDERGNSIIGSDANAQVISTIVCWCVGPNRIAIDAPEFSPSGNELKLKGRVIAALMPDWLAGVWMNDMGDLGGKLKLMPLPAWKEGGRRTSVRGGTMIAIPKTTRNFESAWAFAKELYLSPKIAKKLFESNHIISPMTDLWDEPYYAVEEPYFSGQQSGLLYIDQAPNVPYRTSSPFHQVAMQQIMDAASVLKSHAESNDAYDIQALMPEAKRLLKAADERVAQEMSRNVFISGQAGGGAGDD
ncbi:MAG: extracellular solute-binding protein [Planctomycetota bacterium]